MQDNTPRWISLFQPTPTNRLRLLLGCAGTYLISAPSLVISPMNSGKLVAIMAWSSTVAGRRPHQGQHSGRITSSRNCAPSAPFDVRVRLGRRFQAGDDAVDVGGGAVLADFPLAVDPGDFDLDADNALDLRGDIGLGSVADSPGRGPPALVLAGQRPDLSAQPIPSSITFAVPRTCTVA